MLEVFIQRCLQFRPLNCADPDEIDQTAFLLNSHWPKSNRPDWLMKSSINYPLSFILSNVYSESVIGHARLCLVPDKSDSLYVESVIIGSKYRGKGFGKRIMTFVEEESRKRGYKKLYLATTDKQSFYEHLGYAICPEKYINFFHGSKNSAISNLMQLFGTMKTEKDSNVIENMANRINNTSAAEKSSDNSNSEKLLDNSISIIKPPPPPPPPILPPVHSTPSSKDSRSLASEEEVKVYMCKLL